MCYDWDTNGMDSVALNCILLGCPDLFLLNGIHHASIETVYSVITLEGQGRVAA